MLDAAELRGPVSRADLLYARVDLVPGDGGEPVLLELELTEPSLFLAAGTAPHSAGQTPCAPPRPARQRPVDRVRAMSQRTLVLLKPDTVRRGLMGEVLGRYEAKGLDVVAMELRHIDAAMADRHYAEHLERDFYPPLRDFVTSGPLVAMVLEGDQAVEMVRLLNGATDGRKALPGTIRGDLSISNRENLVHGSDSPESAEREIALWFPDLT